MTTIEKRYLNALTELHTVLKHTDKVNLRDFKIRHKLSSHFNQILRESKIIKNNGGVARSASYEWVSITPNIHMAKAFIKEHQSIVKRYNAKSRNCLVPPKKIVKSNANPTIQNNILTNVKEHKLVASETRYFFGLIKIKTKYIYKN